MSESFVAFRVKPRYNETNRAAFARTMRLCGLTYPLTLVVPAGCGEPMIIDRSYGRDCCADKESDTWYVKFEYPTN